MFRRSLLSMQANARRTVVRDPRKTKKKTVTKAVSIRQENQSADHFPMQSNPSNSPPPTPFHGMAQNQEQSVGSTFGTYMLLGAGVTMGFTVVRLIFGI